MHIQIRQEASSDYAQIEHIITKAFENAEHSSGTESQLVSRLRRSANFIKELSLVAQIDQKLVGHILFTMIDVDVNPAHSKILALAPVSVLPEYQGQKIGAALIGYGHKLAKDLGYDAVILLGHPQYYPRFGYRVASGWGIRAPFDVPDEAFMALELSSGALSKVSGVVRYPPEFSE